MLDFDKKTPIRSAARALRGVMGVLWLAVLAAGCTETQAPVGVVRVTDEVVLAAPERLGVNLGMETYYGDQQYVEDPLLHGGFSKGRQVLVVRTRAGDAHSFGDADFDANDRDRKLARELTGGTYHVATGPRQGERGRITAHDLATGTFTTEKSGPAFVDDDFVWLHGPDAPRGEPDNDDPNLERGLGIGDFRLMGDDGAEIGLVASPAGGRDQAVSIQLPPEPGELGAGLKHYLRVTPDTTYRLHIRARTDLPGARITATLVNLAIETGEHRNLGFDLIHGGPLSGEWRDLTYETRTPSNPGITQSFSAIEIVFAGENKGTAPAGAEIDSVWLEDLRLQSDTAFARQVVSTLKEARVGTLRFYGVYDIGVPVADITARDAGAAGWSFLALDSGYRLGQVTATVDECLGLAREAGARPWLTIGNGNTPEDWYALISYLAAPADFDADSARRAANGKTAPWTEVFDRIYLEIGNEWWNPIFYPFHVAYPGKYAEICRHIIARVRSHPYFAAEKFEIIAGGWAINAHNWNGITDAGSDGQDYVSVAPYVLNDLDDARTAQDKYGALFASVDAYLAEGGASTRKALETNGKGTRLAVYELNTHLTGGRADEAAASEICTSAAAGVAVLDQAISVMSHLGASPVNYFVLLQRAFNGREGLWGNLVREADGGLRPRPVWHGLRLANQYFIAGDLVRTTVDGGGAWDQPVNGSVPAMQDVPNLHAYACLARDGATGKRKANVLLINRAVKLPVRAEVALPFSPAAEARSVTLVGNTPSQNNESDELVSLHESTVHWPAAGGMVLLPPCSATVLQFSEI